MEYIRKFLFPVAYPGAIIWHIILGGIIAAIFGIIAFGYNGYGDVWLPIVGAVIVAALAPFFYVRK